MKLVVDSNRLQAGELHAFLGRSKSNVAVLTDYAAMEAYKGDTLASIFKSTGMVIEEIANLYSKEERRSLREGEVRTSSAVDKTVKNVIRIAGQTFQEHPDVNFVPTYEELGNTFIFRVSLCTYLLALDWGARGGARDARPSKLWNDFVDMNFAAYATYFDGLMSADAKVCRLHREVRIWLIALFGCQLPSGLRYDAFEGGA